MTLLFWILLVTVVYSVAGYGLIWSALAALFGRPHGRARATLPVTATVLVAARNEEATIADKIVSLLAQQTAPHRVRILVVSDGSEDAKLAGAQQSGDPRVTAFQTAEHGGKAEALNGGAGHHPRRRRDLLGRQQPACSRRDTGVTGAFQRSRSGRCVRPADADEDAPQRLAGAGRTGVLDL